MDLALVFRRSGAAWRTWAASPPFREVNLATLLIFCALLFPFVFRYHRYPIPSFYQEWLAIFLSLAAVILVTTQYRSERFVLPFSAFIPLALVPSVLIHLVAGNALIVHGPPLHLISVGSAVLLMTIGRKLDSARQAVSLADVMAAAFVAGALAASVASWHWRFRTGLLDPLPWDATAGWLGQRNQHALHLWLGVLGISHFVLNRKVSWFHYLVCLEILAEAAVYTGSRSVFLYAVGGLALAIWAAAKSRSPDARKRLLLIGICPVVFLAIIQGARLVPDREPGVNPRQDSGAIQRYAPATVMQDPRLELWLSAAQITQASPWVGSGPGSYIRESWVLADSLPATTTATIPATHAHNMFLQVGAELGVPTAFALAGLIGAWLMFALRQIDWQANWLYVAIPFAILIHNQVEFSLWYLFFLVPTALAMGAAIKRSAGTGVPALALLAVAVLGFGLAARLAQDYRVLEGLIEKSTAADESLDSLIVSARHPIFGAWASTSIAGQTWRAGLTPQLKYWHAARALYVVPLHKNVLRTYIESLEHAGQHSAAATERRISQRSAVAD